MVEAVELSAAEIETLRKIVNGELDREADYAAIIAANKTLDRLSPPAPGRNHSMTDDEYSAALKAAQEVKA